jgi:transposase
MKRPIFVRPITDAERQQLEAGLRLSDAFVLRRCQILLASARGELAPQMAHHLGCDSQTVRNAIWAFHQAGLSCLSKGSSRPHTTRAAFPGEKAEALRTLLHQSPRTFMKPTSLWTLKLAAEVSVQQGLTPQRVSGETIPATLARLGVRWQRANMLEKRGSGPPDPSGSHPSGLGPGL